MHFEAKFQGCNIGFNNNFTCVMENKGPRFNGVEIVAIEVNVTKPWFQYEGAGLQDCDFISVATPVIDQWLLGKRI